ncbi:ciliogenesis-associated TTC17-interacting protein [Pteronotus mesoamericanus]|uniref:ciliogenesis-associated TTC17-interacting protein n=1 Tax=Pteronotus mesoamericanus TaxID=1884717 RepID=UPI0023ECF517|nr:ciliogenesis-associated TTC17-interacting protein [Pteronotus parnellii mesoamericanus]
MSSKVQSKGSAISVWFPSIDPRAKEQQASDPETLPPLKASAEAVHFLASLRQEELQKLFFSETLAVVSDTGEPEGELTIEVKRGTHESTFGVMSHCPLVHAVSRGFMDNMLYGNSLLGYLTWNLEILEQHSQEFIKFHVLPMERKMSLLKEEGQLAMTRSVKEGEEVRAEVTFFPSHSTEGFISEAANLLMLRVMAWRQVVPSNARFLALDTEGKLCYSTYEALGSQTMQVGRQQVEVFIVEQTVHSDEGIPLSCQYYLLPDGHLAKRVQVGSPGCCVITKMPVLREQDEIEPRPVFEKKPLAWEEDVEFYSRFLERKEELRLSHTRYLQQQPDAEALVSDFLLFLLLRKPSDVITFAAEFFGPFSARHPRTPSLRSSNRPSPFRSLDPSAARPGAQLAAAPPAAPGLQAGAPGWGAGSSHPGGELDRLRF